MQIDITALKFMLIERGLTYRQLARAAGLAESTIYKLFKDDAASRNFNTIGRIAKALDVPARDFVVMD